MVSDTLYYTLVYVKFSSLEQRIPIWSTCLALSRTDGLHNQSPVRGNLAGAREEVLFRGIFRCICRTASNEMYFVSPVF